jgi:hypothetical protein
MMLESTALWVDNLGVSWVLTGAQHGTMLVRSGHYWSIKGRRNHWGQAHLERATVRAGDGNRTRVLSVRSRSLT